MMRPIILSVLDKVPGKPNPLAATALNPTPDTAAVQLTWTDPTPPLPANWGNLAGEIGFQIERATGNGPFKVIAKALANQTSYTDNTVGAKCYVSLPGLDLQCRRQWRIRYRVGGDRRFV